MNRRDFLKGMGIGVGAAGIATVIREASDTLIVPEFTSLKELDPVLRFLEGTGPLPDVELARRFVGFAAALPDNPAAIVPVYLFIRKAIWDSPATPEYKSALIGGPECTAFLEKHGHWLS